MLIMPSKDSRVHSSREDHGVSDLQERVLLTDHAEPMKREANARSRACAQRGGLFGERVMSAPQLMRPGAESQNFVTVTASSADMV